MAGRKLRGEIELTKEYFGVIGDVYREKGPLAAIGYDISSTIHSIGKRLANLFDVQPDESREQTPSEINQHGYKGRLAYSNEEWHRWKDRKARRGQRTRDYLLRYKKQRDLSRLVTLIFFMIGGIALSLGSLTTTGNAISNLTGTTPGLLGIILFVAGLIGMFFHFRRK